VHPFSLKTVKEPVALFVFAITKTSYQHYSEDKI
jgi:hypothetical protein